MAITFFNPDDVEDFWTRPMEWLRNEGMMVDTVHIKILRKHSLRPHRQGSFNHRAKHIALFREVSPALDVTLLHELVHAWQQAEGYLQERFSPPPSYMEYLLLPHEAEAFWWTNEYSMDVYGVPTREWLVYEEEGFSLF